MPKKRFGGVRSGGSSTAGKPAPRRTMGGGGGGLRPEENWGDIQMREEENFLPRQGPVMGAPSPVMGDWQGPQLPPVMGAKPPGGGGGIGSAMGGMRSGAPGRPGDGLGKAMDSAAGGDPEIERLMQVDLQIDEMLKKAEEDIVAKMEGRDGEKPNWFKTMGAGGGLPEPKEPMVKEKVPRMFVRGMVGGLNAAMKGAYELSKKEGKDALKELDLIRKEKDLAIKEARLRRDMFNDQFINWLRTQRGITEGERAEAIPQQVEQGWQRLNLGWENLNNALTRTQIYGDLGMKNYEQRVLEEKGRNERSENSPTKSNNMSRTDVSAYWDAMKEKLTNDQAHTRYIEERKARVKKGEKMPVWNDYLRQVENWIEAQKQDAIMKAVTR